jgi:hypothetical protein
MGFQFVVVQFLGKYAYIYVCAVYIYGSSHHTQFTLDVEISCIIYIYVTYLSIPCSYGPIGST